MTTRFDPTRTTTLQNEYKAEMRRRFYTVRSLVTKAIWKQDALGLNEKKPLSFNAEEAVLNALPGNEAWRFLTDSEKIKAFRAWLQVQIDTEILSVGIQGNPWSATYIDSAYRRGIVRAFNDVNAFAAAEPLEAEFFQGSRAQFLESAFTQGERLSKLQFLYTRSFEELTGITNAMAQQMSRVLADAIAQGGGARATARLLSNTITGITKKRALVLARTELIAAHAEGQLDAFEELGIEKIRVLAEWSTVGDDLVCVLCEPLEGAIMTVKEARGLIPRHPNCRCAWIPAGVGERSDKAFKKARKATPGKVKDSLKAELPARSRVDGELVPNPQTIDEAIRRSTWAGAENKRRVCNHLETNQKWFNDYMEAIREYRN